MRLNGVLSLLLAAGAAQAQDVISARAGLIHHTDGKVLLNGKPFVHRAAQFLEIRDNGQLTTERGRAEILLTPGVFLRVGADSRVEMVSSRLEDVRMRLAAGSAVVEADEMDKANSVTLLAGSAEISLVRAGLYRLDAAEGETPRLRVFAGEALVRSAGGEQRLKSKREVDLAGDFTVRKFDPEDTDPLDRWSKRRAGSLSAANISAGRMAYRSGMSFTSSRWVFNPYYGMMTFLPYRDVAWSPYGYGFYSPQAVYYLYNRPRVSNSMAAGGSGYNPNYGYSTRSATSAGTSGVIASSPSSPAASGGNGGGGAAVSRGGATGGGGARR